MSCNENENIAGSSLMVDLTIGGVKVRFPFTPYPAQKVLMSKIIMGCRNSQNCLLESPTGSGKTLALLCAALAWQSEEYIKKRKFDAENLAAQLSANDGSLECDKCNCSAANQSVKSEVISEDEDGIIMDDDFKPEPRKPLSKKQSVSSPPAETTHTNEMFDCECGCHLPSPKMAFTGEYHVPRIYYGTRTHKQIAQLASELGQTSYRNTKMTILASREHTCINEVVATGSNKGEECKKLLEQPGGGACTFKHRVHKMDDFGKLYDAGLREAWDLEMFVDAAREKGACPYFSVRELLSKADLVFCPYNYLIDPFIRSSMGIELKKDVVIFDEAHNIEDACREAATIAISNKDIEIAENSFKGNETPLMLSTLEALKNYINVEGDKINGTEVGGLMVTGPTLTGADMVAHIENRLGLDHGTCAQLSSDLEMLASSKQENTTLNPDDRSSTKNKDSAVSVKLESLLSGLIGITGFIQKNGYKYAEDFRMLVSKQQVTVEENNARRGRFMRKNYNNCRHEIVFSLHFWCLNPAVVFESVVENARSIILASGTLSPMSTFQSELGTTFPIQYEAGHVIKRNQIFAGCLGESPDNKMLQGTYKFTEHFEFQDGIGQVVHEVCKVTPGGVLVFFTSYRLIEKIVDRWKSTGLHNQISGVKKIFVETSGGGAHFEETLADFYAHCSVESAEGGVHVLTDEDDDADEFEEQESTPNCSIAKYFGNRSIKGSQKRKIDEIGKKRKGVTPMSQRGRSDSHRFSKQFAQDDGTTGALFLAVFRGKVSEGMNFTDNYARAVIVVGIPYPSVQDPLVKEKRHYNDVHCKERQILTGSEWYECQAFRALNQALGRCIRHRKDWGAIILLDQRFCVAKMRGNEKVSKWVRERRVMYSNYKTFHKCLVDFMNSEKFPDDKMKPAIRHENISQQSQPSQLQSQSRPQVQALKSTFSFTPTSQIKRSIRGSPADKTYGCSPLVIPKTAVTYSPKRESTSPDIFDSRIHASRSATRSAASHQSISSLIPGNSTSIPVFELAPPLQNHALPMIIFHVCCKRCAEEVFFGNCSDLPGQIPSFLTQYFSKSYNRLPEQLKLGDCGSLGVRGNDNLISTISRVEALSGCVKLNATFETDDMVTFESYQCKCFTDSRNNGDVICWSVVGVQPGNTPPAICELLNKVIFNPNAATFSSVLSN